MEEFVYKVWRKIFSNRYEKFIVVLRGGSFIVGGVSVLGGD